MWCIKVVFLHIEFNIKLWYLNSLSCKVSPDKSLNFNQSKKFLINLVFLLILLLYLITALSYRHSISDPINSSRELKTIWAGLIHLSVSTLFKLSLRQIILIDWLELLRLLLVEFRWLVIWAYYNGVSKLRGVSCALSLGNVLIHIALKLLI